MGIIGTIILIFAVGTVLVKLAMRALSAFCETHTFTYTKEPITGASSFDLFVPNKVDSYKLVALDEPGDGPVTSASTYETDDGRSIFQFLEICSSTEDAVRALQENIDYCMKKGSHDVATKFKVVSKKDKELLGTGVSLGGSEDGKTYDTVVLWHNRNVMRMLQGKPLDANVFFGACKY